MEQSDRLVWDDYSVYDEDTEAVNLLHIDHSSFFFYCTLVHRGYFVSSYNPESINVSLSVCLYIPLLLLGIGLIVIHTLPHFSSPLYHPTTNMQISKSGKEHTTLRIFFSFFLQPGYTECSFWFSMNNSRVFGNSTMAISSLSLWRKGLKLKLF